MLKNCYRVVTTGNKRHFDISSGYAILQIFCSFFSFFSKIIRNPRESREKPNDKFNHFSALLTFLSALSLNTWRHTLLASNFTHYFPNTFELIYLIVSQLLPPSKQYFQTKPNSSKLFLFKTNTNSPNCGSLSHPAMHPALHWNSC